MNKGHRTSDKPANLWPLRQWMKIALEAGQSGTKNGEHPFGAAIYGPNGDVISAACNTVKSSGDPSRHAEVNAIAAACKVLSRTKLNDCWLLATAEPCLMCLSCAAIAGIEKIAFGAPQAVVQQAGYGGLGLTGRDLAKQINANIKLLSEILGEDCISLLLSNPKQ